MTSRTPTTLVIPTGLSFWQALQAGYLPPLQSEKYLDFVRSLPCAVSGSRPATAHHLVGHGLKPHGGKTSDLLAIPLHYTLHLPEFPNGLHHLGHRQWEKRFEDQRILALQTLVEAIYSGVIKVA